MDRVEVDGLTIAFERRGRGDPLVLLHGLPGDSRVWRRQLATLSEEHDVVAWDAPGCGRSSDPAAAFGTLDVARCLGGLVDALGLGRPHLVGVSWGAGIALALHAIAPQRPRSLVLAGGYAGWAGSLPPEMLAPRLEAYLTVARAPRAERDEIMRGWAGGLVSPAASADAVDELLAVGADFHPGPLETLARSFAETDLRDVLATIRVPTLVLQGEVDTRSPIAVGRALHDAIPGSRLTVLPGVGHVSNVDAPDAFDAAVLDFLRTVP
jgi:pimeloyl-ACP methyl ester carboxylesterase